MKTLKYLLLACAAVLAVGCSKVSPESEERILEAMPEKVQAYTLENYKTMLSKDQTMELSMALMQQSGILFDGSKITPAAGSVAEGDNLGLLVCTEKVQYVTKGPSGEDIRVSGRITFPFFPSMVRNIVLCPMMTTMDNSMSPSVLGYAMPADLLAILGYVVVSPDYIGYGDSKSLPHPYIHNELTAQTCVDMLDIMGSELSWYWKFRKGGMPRDIYIMGYSQGGGAALSCARRVEEERSREYTILRTYAGAGPYMPSATMDHFRSSNAASMPSVLAYVVLGLQYGDGLDINLRNVFKEELYENYQEWFMKKDKSPVAVDNLMTHNGALTRITDYLNDDFILPDFGGNADIQAVYDACLHNDNIDWTPHSPLLLVHSVDDEVVPFINAQKAYDSFISRGADPSTVRLMKLSGSTHALTALPFYTKVAQDLR